MKRTTIYLPEELLNKIKAMSEEEKFARCSMTELVRILVSRGLEVTAGREI